jgi:hypothetical protein
LFFLPPHGVRLGICKRLRHRWKKPGSFTIAKDLLPINLPAADCPVDLLLVRERQGRFDPAIETGEFIARQFGGTRVILKP